MHFGSIEDAVADIRAGRMVIVVDDEDRENEGDFIMAAEKCALDAMATMIRHGSGIVCVPTTGARLRELDIPMMVRSNTSRLGTAMAVTVDARSGTTTGVSAADRVATVRVLHDPSSRPSDLTRPGHIVPLRAEDGGVLKRAGHTEAAVDLCTMAGLRPVGVLCEVMNDDGTMARLSQLWSFAERLGLRIVTIADLIAYRRRTERLITRVASTSMPTRSYGVFAVHAYESTVDPYPAVALVKGDISGEEPVLVRVHSSCFTGDLLESLRCDCGDQLHMALSLIAETDRGVLIYLQQEGRGIGMVNKIRAYELQDHGADTVQANERLGFKPDLRDYGIGAQIMVDLGLRRIRAITNNPAKIAGIAGYGLEVVGTVPVAAPANAHNVRYLRTKVEKLGHAICVVDNPETGRQQTAG
ncbi:MAG TPA: bifunctional 3,4-dihydroxy-2-butanone-4-phosphate synthase/GTP cyclohydrolase II [Chthonomonadales bacterium]|nr:bifunctional 3,4-dihydroxy-2-butanone-4-phosphate synthase/GTP cyclohydrolase II [Chthonomonadales bacterium]